MTGGLGDYNWKDGTGEFCSLSAFNVWKFHKNDIPGIPGSAQLKYHYYWNEGIVKGCDISP